MPSMAMIANTRKIATKSTARVVVEVVEGRFRHAVPEVGGPTSQRQVGALACGFGGGWAGLSVVPGRRGLCVLGSSSVRQISPNGRVNTPVDARGPEQLAFANVRWRIFQSRAEPAPRRWG
jgi:hypothetical protein